MEEPNTVSLTSRKGASLSFCASKATLGKTKNGWLKNYPECYSSDPNQRHYAEEAPLSLTCSSTVFWE